MTSMIEDGSAARTADDRRASREIIGRIVDAASTNRGRLPMLDSIFERFEFMITGAFRQLTAVHIESSAPKISSGPFSQIVEALPVPCFSVIAMFPQWDSPILVVFDAAFAYSLFAVWMRRGRSSPGRRPVRQSVR